MARKWRKPKSRQLQPKQVLLFFAAAVTALGGLGGLIGTFTHDSDSKPRDWRFHEFRSDVTVRPDGVVRVAEEYHVEFHRRRYHGVFRTIPRRGPHSETHDRRVAIKVLSHDAVMGEEQVEVRTGSEFVRLRGRQDFGIRYDVRGAVEETDDGVKVVWNVTGHDWPVPIGRVVGSVAMPGLQRVECFQGEPGSTDPCRGAFLHGERAVFSAGPLAPGEEVTVAMQARPGSVAAPAGEIVRKPGWKIGFRVTPARVGATALTALLFLGGVGARAVYGRDRGGRVPSPVAFRPPAGLTPAEIGLLYNEFVSPEDVAATVVDLARRGHIEIKDRIRWHGEWEWVLVRRASDDPLTPWEERLMEGLFRGRPSVALLDLEGTFDEDYDAVASILYGHGVEQGWFTAHPYRVRRRWLLVGWFGTLVAAVALVAAYETSTWALPFVPPLLAGLFLLFFWRRMPARTAAGTELVARVRGFRRYLTTAEADELRYSDDRLEMLALLPYAMALSVADRWAELLGDAIGPSTADWAGPFMVGGGVEASSSVGNFSEAMLAGLTTGPGTGGGSSSSAGGGYGGGGGGAW